MQLKDFIEKALNDIDSAVDTEYKYSAPITFDLCLKAGPHNQTVEVSATSSGLSVTFSVTNKGTTSQT